MYNISCMAKSNERQKARKLRKGGESIKVIARLLKVSPSSVSSWCKDVKLTPEQILVLEAKARDPMYGKRLEYSQKQQKLRLEKTNKLIDEGVKEIGELNKRELFLTGAALYWAEGFKKDSQAGFANQDPSIMKFFLRWIKTCFGYTYSDLIPRVTANISHKGRIDEIQSYWSSETGIPVSYFQKPFYQNVKWKKVYDNPSNYYGVLRIKVRKSTDFLRKLHGFIEGLKTNSFS